MPVEWVNSFSSNVDAVGYDATTRELYVTWTTGKTSIYSGVPADMASEAQRAYSVGNYIRENIKPQFAHRYG